MRVSGSHVRKIRDPKPPEKRGPHEPHAKVQVFKIKRHARFVVQNPSVMPWTNVKRFPRPYGDFRAVNASNRHASRNDISDMSR